MMSGTHVARRLAVAARPVPYPPSPAWIPADLTDLGADSARDAKAVLTALVLFLGLYALLLLACLAAVAGGVVLTVRYWACTGIPFVVIGVVLGILLLRVLFHRPRAEQGLAVEVTEDDQPVLFGFLKKLAREVGAPSPDRVFVTPEVNAAVVSDVSLANLFVPPRRHLHIGLGLVNVLTLSEFKAVMAHEFGHFAQQTGRVHAYTEVAMRVMQALKGGEDWVGREMKAAGRAAASGADSTLPLFFAVFVAAPVWCVSQLGGLLFYLVHVSRLSLSRSHEFHADRVAVSVAGSNAIVHGLARINFAEEALSEARRALEGAAEHNLYTRDLYFHHTTSAERLRRVRRDPSLGRPPALRSPAEGQHVQVFDEKDDDGPPLMWRTHPRNFDREENAKKVFVPAEEDDRSPWILFDDADDLRERVTRKFYRALFRVKKSARFRPPTEVQAFVDEEHPELAFDAKYRGAYDERWIDPGRVSDLSQEVANDPWDAARLGQAHDRLYREIGRRAEDLRDLQARIREVYRKAYGRPRGRATRRLQDLEEDLADLVTWFKAFDRRAYLIHAQMAAQLGPRRLRELSDRYHFHLAVQAMHRNLVRATQQVEDALTGLFQESETELPSDFFQWVRDSCQAGRKTMLECVWRARELDPLEVPGVPSGVRFDRVIFDEKVLDEPPLQFIRGRWVVKLVRQMNRMRARLRRLDFKSLAALLEMQDGIAAEWAEQVAPDVMPVEDRPESAARPPGDTARDGQ
jgi:Zn-dependent protease with chaperone function